MPLKYRKSGEGGVAAKPAGAARRTALIGSGNTAGWAALRSCWDSEPAEDRSTTLAARSRSTFSSTELAGTAKTRRRVGFHGLAQARSESNPEPLRAVAAGTPRALG